MRCSPIVDVVEALLGKGFEIRIYDRNVKISELTGTNKDFIMAKIPHLQHFVTADLDAVCSESDVLVVTELCVSKSSAILPITPTILHCVERSSKMPPCAEKLMDVPATVVTVELRMLILESTAASADE